MHLSATATLLLAASGVFAATATQPSWATRPSTTQASQHIAPVRASRLIGMEVYNHQDKHLGEISDVVVDDGGRRIGYAVVSYGGLLGMGDKLFAIPYRMLEYSTTRDSRVYISLDEQTLKAAPGFSKDAWPQKADTTYYRELDRYYLQKEPRQSTAEPKEVLAATAPVVDGLLWTRRLSALIGANVESPRGEHLGEIKDVVIDWESGTIEYDVLSFGGVLGLGDKLVAIRPNQLSSQNDKQQLLLNVDKQSLDKASSFDERSWPNLADQRWRQQNDQSLGPRAGQVSADEPADH